MELRDFQELDDELRAIPGVPELLVKLREETLEEIRQYELVHGPGSTMAGVYTEEELRDLGITDPKELIRWGVGPLSRIQTPAAPNGRDLEALATEPCGSPRAVALWFATATERGERV